MYYLHCIDLGHLSGDWNQDGLYIEVTHPDITVRFSHYRGNDRIIYWRELLQ